MVSTKTETITGYMKLYVWTTSKNTLAQQFYNKKKPFLYSSYGCLAGLLQPTNCKNDGQNSKENNINIVYMYMYK